MEDKKTRIDKGTVKIVERDEIALQWIAEQGGINLDHLAVLLTRSQMVQAKTTQQGEVYLISAAGVKQVLRRWLKAGWVAYTNPFRTSIHPGYVWLTHAGLQDFGLEFRYMAFTVGTLRHFDAVNKVRLWLEDKQGFEEWISERILRREQKIGKHIPDAEVIFAGNRVAIEVELQRKSHKRLSEIMAALEARYKGTWYFVNSESEAGVSTVAKHRTIQIRHLDKLQLYASALHHNL